MFIHYSKVCSFRFRHWSCLQSFAQVLVCLSTRCTSRKEEDFLNCDLTPVIWPLMVGSNVESCACSSVLIKLHVWITFISEKQHEPSSRLDRIHGHQVNLEPIPPSAFLAQQFALLKISPALKAQK